MTMNQEDTSPCTSEPLDAEAKCEKAAYAEMNALDAQEELSSGDDVQPPNTNVSRLVGVVQSGCYNIGVVRAEDFNDAGEFTIPIALIYSNIDNAIAEVEQVLAHAKKVREQLVYEQGVAAGRAQFFAEKQGASDIARQDAPKFIQDMAN